MLQTPRHGIGRRPPVRVGDDTGEIGIGTIDPSAIRSESGVLGAALRPIPISPVSSPTRHGRTPTDSVAGSLSITQYVLAVGGGAIISGRYQFAAQRLDLYGNPLGSETIRGTFVAPLRERHTTVRGDLRARLRRSRRDPGEPASPTPRGSPGLLLAAANAAGLNAANPPVVTLGREACRRRWCAMAATSPCTACRRRGSVSPTWGA